MSNGFRRFLPFGRVLLQVLVEDALPGASVEMGGSGNHAIKVQDDGLVGKRGHSIWQKWGLKAYFEDR